MKISILYLGLSISIQAALEEANTEDTIKGIDYVLTFDPPIDSTLEKYFLEESKLTRLNLNRPASRQALYKRALRDQELFQKIAHREGYLDARVSFQIKLERKNSELSTERDIYNIVFAVHQGTPYTIASVAFKTEGSYTHMNAPARIEAVTKISAGTQLQLDKAHKARPKIAEFFKNNGFPFVEVDAPIGTIDHSAKTVHITYTIREGHPMQFGHTKITGLQHLRSSFIANRLTWSKDQPYDARKLTEFRNNLLKTNIISTVHIESEQSNQSSPLVPSKSKRSVDMHVTLTEGLPRRVGFGGRYSTSYGIGGQVLWHHYNLLGGGEHLGATLRSSPKEKNFQMSLDLPDIGGPQNQLSIIATATDERYRAFKAKTISQGINYEWFVNSVTRTSIGILNEDSRATIRSVFEPRTRFQTHLIGLPLGFTINTSDSLLDPSRGIRLQAASIHYWNKSDLTRPYLMKLNTSAAIYLPIFQDDYRDESVVFAAIIRTGTLFVKDFDHQAPPTKRFFSGGPHSVRGYGYQKIGPMDVDGIPLGGRSLLEMSAELRLRVNETIGLATFIDAGSVSTAGFNISQKQLFIGPGIGMRYYSPIGPIRLDIAVPTKRRRLEKTGKRLDAPFQFYISIGQSF